MDAAGRMGRSTRKSGRMCRLKRRAMVALAMCALLAFVFATRQASVDARARRRRASSELGRVVATPLVERLGALADPSDDSSRVRDEPRRAPSATVATVLGGSDDHDAASPTRISASSSASSSTSSSASSSSSSVDPAARALAEAVGSLSLPPGALVSITFADSNVRALALNWASHLRAAGVPHVVGAMDTSLLTTLRALPSPTAAFAVPFDQLDGGSAHSSDSWKRFARMRIGQVRALLEMGHDVLMSDVDVVWRRDPRPYLLCRDEDADARTGAWDDCGAMTDADVAVSSDNLSPKTDASDGAAYARGGVFNTGIVFIRRTRDGRAFAASWDAHLNARDGRYAALTSDQQVFNAMTRLEGEWPGLDARDDRDERAGASRDDGDRRAFPERVLIANGLTDGSTFALGTLPVALFNPGHVAFVQRVEDAMPGARPVAAHATYTFDGSTGDAKRFRFAEVGLWDPASDEPDRSAHSATRYLAFDAATIVSDVPRRPSIGAHLDAGARQIDALKHAAAVARVLDRTLVVPRLTCFCDKVWGGHDNIWNFDCHYPGSADSAHVPGPCPLDHFVSPSALRRAGVRFVAEAELTGLGVTPTDERRVRVGERGDEGGGDEGGFASAGDDVFLPAAADESVIRRLLGEGDVGRATVLRLSDASDIFGGFVSESDARAFNREVTRALRPQEWCSECHPRGCKNILPPETLAKGTLRPVREVHDQFCATFEEPKPVEAVGEGRASLGGGAGGARRGGGGGDEGSGFDDTASPPAPGYPPADDVVAAAGWR